MNVNKKKIAIAAAAVGVPLVVSFIFAVVNQSPKSSSLVSPQAPVQDTQGSALGAQIDAAPPESATLATSIESAESTETPAAEDPATMGMLPGETPPPVEQEPASDSVAVGALDSPKPQGSDASAVTAAEAGLAELATRVASILDRLTGVESKTVRIAELEARIAALEKAVMVRDSRPAQDVREAPVQSQRTSGGASPEAQFKLTHAGFSEDGETVSSRIAVEGPGTPIFTLKRRDSSSYVLTVDDSVSLERIPAPKGRLSGARLNKVGSKRQFVYSSKGPMDLSAVFAEGSIQLTFKIDKPVNQRVVVASSGPVPAAAPAASLMPASRVISMPVSKDWNVQAITPNIAVIFRNDTREMLAVSVGSTIGGCGLVQALDIGSRMVRTDSCEIR